MCSNWTLVLTTDKLLLHQLAMSLSREPNTVQFHIDINVNVETGSFNAYSTQFCSSA